ncbi:hypothetical protein [Mucilaginibacter sp. UYCu711]|uniref:hypothetical protein n=1 Tax=Mucilaginibacter sp. UYCu711 TaxID=3156339 RepID=UPI003D19BEF2
MKTTLVLSVSIFALFLLITSCTKQVEVTPTLPLTRTIKFNLYTEQDFSTNNHNITFSLFIRNHTKTLFDSTITTMKIKDIPKLADKLVFEKKIFYDNSELAAGFTYYIQDVGSSWHLDTLAAGQNFKLIDYSFR